MIVMNSLHSFQVWLGWWLLDSPLNMAISLLGQPLVAMCWIMDEIRWVNLFPHHQFAVKRHSLTRAFFFWPLNVIEMLISCYFAFACYSKVPLPLGESFISDTLTFLFVSAFMVFWVCKADGHGKWREWPERCQSPSSQAWLLWCAVSETSLPIVWNYSHWTEHQTHSTHDRCHMRTEPLFTSPPWKNWFTPKPAESCFPSPRL